MSTGITTAIVLTSVTMLAATTMDPTLIAAAVVTVIAALGGVIVQIINSSSAAKDRREAAAERKALFEQGQHATKLADENIKKADVLVTTTAEIKELTNSTNSNLQKALDLMTEKNAGLEKLMQQMEQEKRTTAATRAVTDLQASAALHAKPPGESPIPGTPVEPTEVKIVNEPSEPVPVKGLPKDKP